MRLTLLTTQRTRLIACRYESAWQNLLVKETELLKEACGKKVDSLPQGYLLLNCNDPEVMLRYDMIDQIGRFSWNEIPLEDSPTKVRDSVTTSPNPSQANPY